MSTEENKAVVRRFVEEVQNRGNVALLDELAAPTFVNHSAQAGLPPGVEGVKLVAMMFRQAFPDGHMTIEDMIGEGATVVTRKTFRGTHQGEFMGIPPKGKPVTMGLIDVVRVVDGRVTEHWLRADTLGLLQPWALATPGQQS